MSYVRVRSRGDKRKQEIAAIHVAKSQLGIDDDTYRVMLELVSGEHGTACRSSADMTSTQRGAVLDHLRRLGAEKPAREGERAGVYPGRPHNADVTTTSALVGKIEAQLADMKLPWSYADAIAERMHGVARVAWVRNEDQLAAIIAALHGESEKRRLNDDIDTALRALSWAPERIVQLLGPLRPNWRRHRPSLRLVHRFLAEQAGALTAEERKDE